MKTSKKLLVMLLMVISLTVIGIRTTYADAFSLQNSTVICDTGDGLTKGDKANCYVMGIPNNNNGSVHGYIAKIYTTKYLSVTESTPVVASTKTAFIPATSATTKKFTGDSMPDSLKNVQCVYDSDNIGGVSDVNSFGCAAYYTPSTSKTNLFSASTIKATSVNVSLLPSTEYGVVAGIVVELDEDTPTVNECGQVCVQIWRVPTSSDYENYNNPDVGGKDLGLQEKNGYYCREVKMKSITPNPDEPPTGAFASYALLLAGALIAVSAITIAKKNNKIYKV